MNASVLHVVQRSAAQVAPSAAWRLRLVAGCAVAIAAAALIGDPASFSLADPELALLLRGMALIKGLLVVAAFALVLWRVGLPIGAGAATGYLAGVATMAFATALIWQLSFIVPAAALFHAAGLLLLVVAWRDDGRPAFAIRQPRRQSR